MSGRTIAAAGLTLDEIALDGIARYLSGEALCKVWFYTGATWRLEAQIKDDETFLPTITMAFDRLKCVYALWSDGEKWYLLSRTTGDCRRYPSREAAEMVAIHGG